MKASMRRTRSIALLAALLALTTGLAACGEYAPVNPPAPEAAETPADSGGESDTDDADPDDGDPEDSDAPSDPVAAAPDAAMPDGDDGADDGGSRDPGTDRRQRGAGGSGGSGGTREPDPVFYRWSLPPSDTSPEVVSDGDAYAYLWNRDCAGAQRFLDVNFPNTDFGSGNPWNFSNPRYALFYAAATAACFGVFEDSRRWYERALRLYGTIGIDRAGHPDVPGQDGNPLPPPRRRGYGEPECDLYRTLTETFGGGVQDSLSCPGGYRPVFVYRAYRMGNGDLVRVFDDPRTDADESLVPAPDSNGDAAVPGCSDQLGSPVYGDPEDEFGFENSGGTNPAPPLDAPACPVEPAAAPLGTEDSGSGTQSLAEDSGLIDSPEPVTTTGDPDPQVAGEIGRVEVPALTAEEPPIEVAPAAAQAPETTDPATTAPEPAESAVG
ncbi:MAG: hypothetical protein ABWY55_06390 [Microbacterium sp.]